MRRGRKTLIWAGLAAAIATPVAAAAMSPLLAWRDPIYIAAGFAGIVAMALLLVQPLLIGGYLPGLLGLRGRRIHRVTGLVLVMAIAIHVAGLWLTSPPDVIDALLFASPTPFSDWGVIAMWAAFGAAVFAAFRRSRPRMWRLGHMSLVAVTVLCSVIHAILIEGTMETISKVALCTLVVLATLKVGADLRIWGVRR
ncbi:ferric reductase-like transmembrane domain-containing protein [Nisaea sp.]|uniref:ferric reductase-like transmembrane domain-containing protein n=1 Tax=Nisaea sp. TaxID=2024842 RepID=UPI003296CC6E